MNPGLAGATFADDFLCALESGSGGPESSGLRILDVGAGTARIPIEICSLRPSLLVTCVDRSPRACQRSRRLVAAAGLSAAIRITQADACALPYSDQTFDAVISNALLHHVTDPSSLLRECLRVLRPGGLLFVRDAVRTSDADTIEQIVATGGSQRVPSSSHRPAGLLNLDQARQLVVSVGLPVEWVRQSGRRHWAICGRLTDSAS